MRTVNVRIGHDNNLMISELTDIKIFRDAGTERRNHGTDGITSEDSVKSCFFYVQNLTAERQDCLCCTVTCRLCGTTCGITLYDVDFAVLRIFIGAIREFTRKTHTVESGFSSGQVSCFSCSIPCTLCHDCLFTDCLRNCGVLL